MQSVDTKDEDIAVSRNMTFEIYKQATEEIFDEVIHNRMLLSSYYYHMYCINYRL